MRFLILSLFFVSSAIAQSNRDLADLMWLPNKGDIFGRSTFVLDGSQVNIDKDTEVDVMKQNFIQDLGYGFTDAFTGVVSYEHQGKGETSTFPGTGTNRDYVDEVGGKNPRLGAIWRVSEQSEGGKVLDVVAGYRPDLVGRDEDEDGDLDAAEGGHTVDLGVRWGEKAEKRQWSLEANLVWMGERTTNQPGGDDFVQDSHFSLEGAANWQAFMLPFLQFRGRLSLARTSAYDSENEATGDEFERDAVYRGMGDATLVWSPWQNDFVIETGVGMFYDYDYDVEVNDNTAEYKSGKGYRAHIGAVYRLF